MLRILLIYIVALVASNVNAIDFSDIDINSLNHPYILFGSEDIAIYQERIQNHPWDKIWANIVSSSPEKTDGVVNAFIYAITGESERGLAAKKSLTDLCNIKSWHNNSPPKLQVSEKCRPAGLMYDMIYDLLSESEKLEFSKKIAQAGIIPLYKHSFMSWWSMRRQHNYSPVFASGYGIAAMAILKEAPEAVEWIDRAYKRSKLFINSQGAGGGYGEGVNYCNMSLRSLMPFMDGLDRIFGVDLYQEKWLAEQVPQFYLYALSPDRRSTLNFNDAGIDRIYDPHVMIRLAGRCGSEYTATIVSDCILGANTPLKFDWPGFGGQSEDKDKRNYPGDIFSFLWLDEDMVKLPLNKLYRSKLFEGIGWSVFRSGWDKDDFQMGVISAPKFFGNHEHADRGSFILNAYGERLISDSGKPSGYDDPITVSWFRESFSHNVMLVNGQGQTMLNELEEPGLMRDFFSTENFDYVCTENAGPYGERVDKWNRHVVYAVGEFAVILDDVSLPIASDIEFRFHSPSNKAVNIDQSYCVFPGDDGGVIPSISRAKAHIEKPMKEEYPDWWQTGLPMHKLEKWDTAADKSADLILQTFSDHKVSRRVEAAYENYRFPSSFLAQSYNNVAGGKFLTILYPRSAKMKTENQLPMIEQIDCDGIAIRVQRANQLWHAASGNGKDNIEAGKLEYNALLAISAERDGLLYSWMMAQGTKFKAGNTIDFVSDLPVTVVSEMKTDCMVFEIEAAGPSGADLRIKFNFAPQYIELNNEKVWACITENLLEYHIDKGRSVLTVKY